jgi:hypothetical protein
MAYLILNGGRPHGGPDAESYYEFDPGNEAALEKIEALLGARKAGSLKSEALLAGHCAASMEESAARVRKATLFGWVEMLMSHLRREKDATTGHHPRRSGHFDRNPAGGKGRTGFERRPSFA